MDDRQEAPQVVLRRITAGDEEEFLALARAHVELHRPWVRSPTTPEEFHALVARSDGTTCDVLLVCAREEGRPIVGQITVGDVVRGPFQSGTLSYAAFAPGRGYMFEGLGLTLRHAFGHLGLHRLEANIQPGNAPARRLVQRHGFRKEGFSPDFLFVDGAWRDHERWAITSNMVNSTGPSVLDPN
ncbi:acetyltransferase [Microtetraspora sp. NBRC 13810]|uniref:GNAT family N-acetyltransferase n=1 Tax=Microtetraspora sp. NBRC 13810 TaxID=3030990 RepID=UPI0024A27F36|nr:GNAT family protein [Microtetraspora sp. NBRC 13810]GLW11137.1 acetyltransferase [Microtetraspora sp. NBRC 13810]